MDKTLDDKIVHHIRSRIPEADFDAALKQFTGKSLKKLDNDEAPVLELIFSWLLFDYRDGSGMSENDLWKAAGYPGLTHDERRMVGFMEKWTVSVVEVQEIPDESTLVCIDLFDPEQDRFIVKDRSCAASAERYMKILTGIHTLPHYRRFMGSGITVGAAFAQTFLKELTARTKDSGINVRDYLKHNFGEARNLLLDYTEKDEKRFRKGLDAWHCTAEYRFTVSRAKLLKAIRNRLEFEPENEPAGTECFVWLKKGESSGFSVDAGSNLHRIGPEGAITVIGNLKLRKDVLFVETFGQGKWAHVQEKLKDFFPGMLELVRENKTDMLKDKSLNKPTPVKRTGKQLPPELEKQIVAEFYSKQYKTFADEPVPMLNNMTPREASKIPAMRGKLVELMKIHLSGLERQKREKGVDVDLKSLIRELGLEEWLPSW